MERQAGEEWRFDFIRGRGIEKEKIMRLSVRDMTRFRRASKTCALTANARRLRQHLHRDHAHEHVQGVGGMGSLSNARGGRSGIAGL